MGVLDELLLEGLALFLLCHFFTTACTLPPAIDRPCNETLSSVGSGTAALPFVGPSVTAARWSRCRDQCFLWTFSSFSEARQGYPEEHLTLSLTSGAGAGCVT